MLDEWRQHHKDQLLDNWLLAEQMKELKRIEPLE